MRITNYDSAMIEFCCDACDFLGEIDISSLLTDNCVVSVDVVCDVCGSLFVLYVLICTDPAEAKLLNAKLEFLKVKRSAEEREDGDKSSE
ncbi:hypothetical protein LCGC14_1791690 [marine sediment metagenome]|uniref:Uncharacterized protein n=1 Tax=marine sediment metagenome TaxID=412755 RepID=A0A0F9GSD2_9ZZZZ